MVRSGELVAYAQRQAGTPVGDGFRQKGIAEATFQIYSHIGSTTRIAPASSGLAKPCARLASPAPSTIPAWIVSDLRTTPLTGRSVHAQLDGILFT